MIYFKVQVSQFSGELYERKFIIPSYFSRDIDKCSPSTRFVRIK